MRISLKTIICIILISLFSVPLISAYLHPGYFSTHDGEWAVVRLSDMFRTLRDHQLPARYSGYLNYGYGYPLFNFAYPFPYYLGVVIHAFHINFIDTIKLLFAITVPLSGIFMYFLSNSFWKNRIAGFCSAILYMYLPYRMVDLYVRGSLGESISFVLFPLVLWQMNRLYKNSQSLSAIFIAGASYAILILTHNIMAVLFSIVLAIQFFYFLFKKNTKVVFSFLFVGFYAATLSAFFWIPALVEKQFILLSKIPIADRALYFISFSDLFSLRWAYGTPVGGVDRFTYQLGLPHAVLFMFFVIFFIFAYNRKKELKIENKSITTIYICTVFFLLFLLFSVSAPFWSLPLLHEINYPWTLLGPIGFLLSLLAGGLYSIKRFRIIVVLATLVGIFLVIPYAKPRAYTDRDSNYYLTNDATTTSSSELMPLWVKQFPVQRAAEKVVIASGSGKIDHVVFNSKQINFLADLNTRSVVQINTIYYPGWQVRANNKDVPIVYQNPAGIITILLPKGRYTINAEFLETPLRKSANIISVVGCITLLALPTYTFLRKRNT